MSGKKACVLGGYLKPFNEIESTESIIQFKLTFKITNIKRSLLILLNFIKN